MKSLLLLVTIIGSCMTTNAQSTCRTGAGRCEDMKLSTSIGSAGRIVDSIAGIQLNDCKIALPDFSNIPVNLIDQTVRFSVELGCGTEEEIKSLEAKIKTAIKDIKHSCPPNYFSCGQNSCCSY